MQTKMEQFPAKNPNPVLSVEKDGTVLYSNEAGEPLLHEWGTKIGEKMPPYIGDFVQKVISQSISGKMEVRVGKRVYLVAFHPLPEEECVNIYGFDISEQKELEEKLQESKEQYRMLFDHSMDGIILTDPRDGGKILSANPAACQMLGWAEEELIGKGRDVFFDLQDPALSALLDERARSGSARAQLTYRRKDGTTFPGEVSTAFFIDNNGDPRTVAIIRDVTERKQAEEALLESEQHYRLLYETMLQGVVYQDASGKIISMNPAAERILGKTPAEFLGSSSVGEEYHTIHEDGSPFPGLEHPAIVSLRTGKKVQDVVMGVYNPRENCYRWISINAVPIFRTGEDMPFKVYTLFDDITERKRAEEAIKESEEKYRSLFSNMSEGFGLHEIILDACGKPSDYRFLELNDAFEKLTGISREKALGRTATEVLPGIDPYWIENYGRVALKGEAIRFENYSTPLGRWYEIYSYSPKKNQFAVMFADITERKQEENRIFRYNRILEGINRIFSSVVKAETEEELGNACLSVALEMTGSQFGFVGEVGADGLLHDIAISDMGWKKCLMYDQTGHQRPPGDFILHGLYGRVIDSGKGFFTNDPQSHPDSIGLPPDHPPLASFLGVPLIQDEKVVGMLAVANREDGYCCEQLEDLEAIAPAVIQALKRKREEQERKNAEKALLEAYEMLQIQNEELQAQSEELQMQSEELQAQPEELQEVNEALRESEERFRTMANAIPQLAWIARADGYIYWYNKRWYAYTGTTPEQMEGWGWQSVHDPATLPKVLEQWKASIATGQMFDMEFPLRGADGIFRPFLTRVFPLKDAKGQVLQWFGTNTDITERKRMEDELKHNEKQYRTLGDTIPYGVWLTDSTGYCTYTSPSFLELVDMSMEQVQKFGWLHLLPPEDVQPTTDHWLRCIQSGENFEREHRFRAKDGSYRNVLAIGRPIKNDEGEITEWVGLNLDVTERKKTEDALRESEARFRTLAENSPDIIARFDRQKRHIFANPAVAEPYGYSPEKIVGKTNSELGMSHELVKFWEEHYENVFTLGKPETMEFQYISPQGKKYYFNTRIVPEFVNGKVTSVLAISRDITDIKKAEAKLKETLDNLERLVKERTAELEEAYNLLKESEQRLQSIIDGSPGIIFVKDLEGHFILISKQLEKLLGMTCDEIRGKTDYDIFPLEWAEYYQIHDRKVLETGMSEQMEEVADLVDGRHVFLANKFLLYDMQGKPYAICGISMDITERKEIEEKIQVLANAVESSNDAIITQSLDGIIASWNTGAEQIYGHLAEEVLGKDVSILEPDNLKGEIKQLIEKTKQEEKVQHYETLRQKKDGTLINASVTLSPVFDASGKFEAISCIARDITERKKAEQALRKSEARLRRFYESGMIGALYYKIDGSITEANDKFLEMIGYTREDLQAGRLKWDKMTPPEYRPLEEYAIAELKATGIATPYEKEYIRKDGSRIPIILGVANIDEACNDGIAFVLDITERKKAEDILAKIEIARKQEIHHRIKNNLQVISSLLDLQSEMFRNRDDIKDSEVLRAFRESQDRVISMALIHEELHKGGEIDTLDFSSYLEELADNLLLTYRLGDKDISLNLDLEEKILFDMDTAVPLGIIVNELVSNSLKHAFIGRDRGEIQIKLHREESEDCKGTSFILIVSDNGIGIPENPEIEDLVSLGMQLVTTLVDQLDGELEMKRNNGTEFTMRFMVTEKNSQASATAPQQLIE